MEESKDMIITDDTNKNLYSPAFIRAIEKLNPDDLLLDEDTLRSRFKATILDHELKQAFWKELALAQKQSRKMKDANVYQGRCVSSYFYSKVLMDKNRMPWMLHPVSSYEDKIESILDSTVQRYNEILQMDISCQRARMEWDDEANKYKRVYYTDTDAKKALVLLQAIKNIEDRVKGATLQKQLMIKTSTPSVREDETADIDMVAVDARLKELEGKLNPYDNTTVDAEFVETTDDDA